MAVLCDDDPDFDLCSIPQFLPKGTTICALPSNCSPTYMSIVKEYKSLFSSIPGQTEAIEHHIPTGEAQPIRVPPRRVPMHYKDEIQKQIAEMLQQGIIQESSSPWLAPCVFVPKKNGELRICVDYRELNKRTEKNGYPLPLPDEVQDRLQNSKVFSKLDCRKGFWQVPIAPEDCCKTAFSPGPGLGLYEFLRLPFGLSGSPGTFQCLMDRVLRGLHFAMVYIDDILIYSENEKNHKQHLKQVLQRIKEHGLTLHSEKCSIGLQSVPYLGHIFSKEGMRPDPSKIHVIQDWPTPCNANEIQRFLGLASYYRRYIKGFANIAHPLYQLTMKGASFRWTSSCQEAFHALKVSLMSEPILTCPNFSLPFMLYTDASDTGLGAVLQQGDAVIAYASRSLKSAEKNYSVIEKECLALVHAVKHFKHYLLGRLFVVYTDHNPLQWLSSQKMEGKLCRWALQLQEFEFEIRYRKGSQNSNADALSRQPTIAVTEVLCGPSTNQELQQAQSADLVISKIISYLKCRQGRPQGAEWRHPQYRRWLQLWPQLVLNEGILYRNITLPVSQEKCCVPIAPVSLRQRYLQQFHDAPLAGHQGYTKTLLCLKRNVYWIGMAKDTQSYCESCDACNRAKPPAPQPVPMINTPIGRPWEMLGVDILKVPISCQGNSYLLVIQDYFTKWPIAIPLQDQTAASVVRALTDTFSIYGIPSFLHSDQGANFESTILKQTCEAFGIHKSRTTAYHPQGDGLVERVNRSLLQMFRTYCNQSSDWEQWLPLLLYAYRSSTHTSTKCSPYLLMFGREPSLPVNTSQLAHDTQSYSQQIQRKLAQMFELVELHLIESGSSQKAYYDSKSASRPPFSQGSHVWLSVPTAGKLDPKWECGWTVTQQIAEQPTVQIKHTDGRVKTVHINRLRLHIIRSDPHTITPVSHDNQAPTATPDWQPPFFEHVIDDGSHEPVEDNTQDNTPRPVRS